MYEFEEVAYKPPDDAYVLSPFDHSNKHIVNFKPKDKQTQSLSLPSSINSTVPPSLQTELQQFLQEQIENDGENEDDDGEWIDEDDDENVEIDEQPQNIIQTFFQRMFGSRQQQQNQSDVPSIFTEQFNDQKFNLDNMPEPMTGHRCCTDGKYLYVFGGYDNNPHENGIWFPRHTMLESQRVDDGNLRERCDYTFRYEGKVKYHCCYQHVWKLDLEEQRWTKVKKFDGVGIGSASGTCELVSSNPATENQVNYAFYVCGTNYRRVCKR